MTSYVEPNQPRKLRWKQRIVNGHYWLDCHHAGVVPVTTFEEISEWSREHKCGVRKAYGTWEFRNEAEITMFLLRWS